MKAVVILGLLIASLFTGAPYAQSAIITFDELPYQSVNGLHYNGVNFGFSINGVPSQDAYYNSFGPSNIEYVRAPLLEGAANGTLTLVFDTPTPFIDFGFVLSSYQPVVSPGVSVQLIDNLNSSQGIFTADAFVKDYGTYVFPDEGFFSYDCGQEEYIKKAIINFNASPDAQRFAFDNLRYDTGVVPEPATAALLLSGLAGVWLLNIKRKRHC